MAGTLDVAGLAYAHDGALAVRNVSLTVQPGEIVALLGGPTPPANPPPSG